MLAISFVGNTFAQTLLNRFPVELKKSSEYFELFNAENTSREYFSFLADKEKIRVLKYNSALFFKDSISMLRTNKDVDFISGVTFSKDGNPNLYWSSIDYEIIQLINFDFIKHTTSQLVYKNNFSRDKIIDAFVAVNAFQILSITAEGQIKCTSFSNTGKTEHLISENQTNKTAFDAAVISTILENGITKIESNTFTPLFVGVAKVKRYLTDDSYILSLDSKTNTTLFTIKFKDFSVQKESFPYEKSDQDSGSNSFLNDGILYQLSANTTSLSLLGIDLNTKKSIGNFQANSKQEIDFKNSPLLQQSENSRSKELKNTSKLLLKLDKNSVGLSIYTTPNYNLFTIGGVREVTTGGGLTLAIGIGFAGAMSGGNVAIAPDFMNNKLQSLYFESFFDADFKHSNAPFRPLYIDTLSEFLNTNRPVVHNVYPFKNYVILNYYDSKTKEFVMRKFEDIKD